MRVISKKKKRNIVKMLEKLDKMVYRLDHEIISCSINAKRNKREREKENLLRVKKDLISKYGENIK